jgi:hypothetical protein
MKTLIEPKKRVDELARAVIGAAIEAHRTCATEVPKSVTEVRTCATEVPKSVTEVRTCVTEVPKSVTEVRTCVTEVPMSVTEVRTCATEVRTFVTEVPMSATISTGSGPDFRAKMAQNAVPQAGCLTARTQRTPRMVFIGKQTRRWFAVEEASFGFSAPWRFVLPNVPILKSGIQGVVYTIN